MQDTAEKLFGFIVGKTIKAAQGSANPDLVNAPAEKAMLAG